MKIFVDPQGNFQQATKYHIDLAKTEPVFKIFVVSDADYITAVNSKNTGNEVKFINGVFKETEKTVDEAKHTKLTQIDVWTKAKITGGFVSLASGAEVTYDSDEETQSTMQTMYVATKSPNFANHPDYQGVITVRGFADGSTVKTVFYLTAPQVQTFMDDMALHIGRCKQEGWAKQALVEAASTVEDLAEIVL